MILLYKGKSAISKAIRWRTWGDYSHAAWMLRDWSVIEAWHKGGVSHNESPAILHEPGTEIDVFDVQDVDRAAVHMFLAEQVGKKYDLAAVVRGFTFRVMRDDPDRWFCSELIHAAARSAGLPLLDRVPDWKVHPTLLSYSPHLEHVGTIKTYEDGLFDFQPVPSGGVAND